MPLTSGTPRQTTLVTLSANLPSTADKPAVRAVYSDGSALVEQYNLNGQRSYGTTRVRAPRYLYYRVA